MVQGLFLSPSAYRRKQLWWKKRLWEKILTKKTKQTYCIGLLFSFTQHFRHLDFCFKKQALDYFHPAKVLNKGERRKHPGPCITFTATHCRGERKTVRILNQKQPLNFVYFTLPTKEMEQNEQSLTFFNGILKLERSLEILTTHAHYMEWLNLETQRPHTILVRLNQGCAVFFSLFNDAGYLKMENTHS